ncbi:MAG: hypothetical protein VX527_01115 [Planctomycetota bacterium]|nr:hypothetical protein [Planctomycetota bacterium]
MSHPVQAGRASLVMLLGVGLALSGCQTETTQPGPASTAARVVVSTPDDPRWPLSQRERAALKQVGFTQVSMPFGVLLAADEEMPPAYVEQAAAILAEMMDQDMNGVLDDPQVAEVLARRDVCWLAMPMDHRVWEEEQLPRLERVLGYDIIIPEWWMEVRGSEPDDHARAVMVEEIHHFMTQFGFSEVYPKVFGVEGWDSVIARETQRAQCDFWQHPENDCPGSPAEVGGDCSDPNCDVVEFYQQVIVMRAGMQPGWLGIGFPRDRAELEARLSDEFKAAVDDSNYHQLRQPLSFSYPVN